MLVALPLGIYTCCALCCSQTVVVRVPSARILCQRSTLNSFAIHVELKVSDYKSSIPRCGEPLERPLLFLELLLNLTGRGARGVGRDDYLVILLSTMCVFKKLFQENSVKATKPQSVDAPHRGCLLDRSFISLLKLLQ